MGSLARMHHSVAQRPRLCVMRGANLGSVTLAGRDSGQFVVIGRVQQLARDCSPFPSQVSPGTALGESIPIRLRIATEVVCQLPTPQRHSHIMTNESLICYKIQVRGISCRKKQRRGIPAIFNTSARSRVYDVAYPRTLV